MHGDEGVLHEEIGIKAINGKDLGMTWVCIGRQWVAIVGLKERKVGGGGAKGVVNGRGGGGGVECGVVKPKAEMVAMGLLEVMGPMTALRAAMRRDLRARLGKRGEVEERIFSFN